MHPRPKKGFGILIVLDDVIRAGVERAKAIFPGYNMHVEASEVLFNTQLRNEFCQNWEGSPVGSTQCMDKDKDFESWAGYRGLFHNISTCAQAAQRDDLGSPQFSRKSNSSMCEYSIVQLLCPITCNACDSEEDKAQEATASGTYVFPTADEYFAFLLKEGSLSQEQYAYTFYSKTKYGYCYARLKPK